MPEVVPRADRQSARLSKFFAATLPLIALAGCSGGVLDPQGPVGENNAKILMDALLIMLVIVIPTILLAFWMAWRYRAGRPSAAQDYLPEWSYSGRVEAVTWAIPILVIMFLGGVIWIGSIELDPFRPLPSKNKTLEVQVVALDWKWLFIYPQQGVATVNQLVIPEATPVHFSITSASVFNVFFIHQLGSMIYAMPGMTSQLFLEASHPATLFGQSAQFSGDGFSDMNFLVHSVPAGEFASWVESTRGTGQALTRANYELLARQSHDVKPFSFRQVDPTLFRDIAALRIGPGPGPEPEGPAHAGREITPASAGRQ